MESIAKERSNLAEQAKINKQKALKETAVKKATVWSADNDDFKNFMNDPDTKKEKATLKPQKSEAGNLIYQVFFLKV